MQGSYFIPKEDLSNFMKDGAMNNQYGIQFFGLADPEAASKVLPPPIKLIDPINPLFYGYVVNIREPSFGSWYMEGGIGLMVKYGEIEGLYFLGLMLSGPGALMAMVTGRETAGLPKKLCERIVVERMGSWGHCSIERKGIKLLDVKLRIGQYNDPNYKADQENCSKENPISTYGNCLLNKYQVGDKGFYNMELLQYDSVTKFYKWEPAEAEVELNSSMDDPWAEVPIIKVLGAGWMISDNWVQALNVLYKYPKDQIMTAMQYLFAGRYDLCTLYKDHQHYE